jgi:hypothetical protein
MARDKKSGSQRSALNANELNHARKTLVALSAAASAARSSQSGARQATKQKTR